MSTVGHNTVTVSGLPSVLKKLADRSSILKNAAKLALPLHAPFHAPKLFHHVDLMELVKGSCLSGLETMRRYRPWLPLFSSSTGKQYIPVTTLDLFAQVVKEILTEICRWDLVLANCASGITLLDDCHIDILAFGPTKASGNLLSAIKTRVATSVKMQDSQTWVSSAFPRLPDTCTSFKDAKIAIVGLAGRFPSGADLDNFWQVLENGLDVHKEASLPLLENSLQRPKDN